MTLPAANGYVSIQGQQWDTAPGGGQIGPFSIPCSAVTQISNVATNQTNFAVPIPTGCTGCVISPNAQSAAGPQQVSVGSVSGQLTRISPQYPTLVTFDPAALPTNLFFTTSNVVGAIVSVQFF